MQAEITYPHRVEHQTKSGTFHVTIYSTPINGNPAFTLAWYECAKRKRKVFADETEAHREADKIVKGLAGAELKLSPDEGRIYTSSIEAIRGIGLTLKEVCDQFAESWKLTGGKVREAALDFSRRDTSAITEKSLADAVREYLDARKEDVSAHYLREYTSKLNQLAESHSGYMMAQLEPHRIDDYLRGLDVTSRTRKNARAVILNFFNWARTHRYVPQSFNFKEGLTLVKAHEGEIEFFTPEELQTILNVTPASMVPFVAIAAFAGLRHAEIARLDWSEIDFRENHIEVKAKNAKTRSRRIVPLLPVLKAWLKSHRKTSGRVCSHANTSNALMRIAERAGIVWQHNVLRHSFISYRCAITKDVAATSLEAGNSPQIVFRNYRALVQEKAARAWFKVRPKGAATATNVIDLPEQKAAVNQ